MQSSTIEKGKIGKKLSILAKSMGLTQKEIAENCQVSRMSIHRFFKGETELKAKELIKLLELLTLFSEKEMDEKIRIKTGMLTLKPPDPMSSFM